MDGFEASTSVDWQASGDVTLLKIKDNVDRVGHLQVQVHPITGDVKVTPDRDTALGNAVGGTDQTPFQYYSSGVLTGSCGTSIDHGVLPPNNNTNTFNGLELKSEKTEDLDVDERNLLSVAYKNIVGAKRASWRTLSGGFDDADEDLLNDYKRIVRKYIRCTEVLKLLTDHLCKNVEGNGDETEVFYLKMCGDYYRYLSEFRTDQENYKKSAEEFYKKAIYLLYILYYIDNEALDDDYIELDNILDEIDANEKKFAQQNLPLHTYKNQGEYKGFGRSDEYKSRLFKVCADGIFECYENTKCIININLLKESWSNLKEVTGMVVNI